MPTAPPKSRPSAGAATALGRYHRANKYFVVFILGTASIVMGRRYMDVMEKLAEGRMTYPDSKRQNTSPTPCEPAAER